MLRSRKVASLRTEIKLFGPTHPMLVPRPPFSFNTTSLSRSDLAVFSGTGGMLLYGRTAPSGRGWIFSQTIVLPVRLSSRNCSKSFSKPLRWDLTSCIKYEERMK